jgi:hypothetical protein
VRKPAPEQDPRRRTLDIAERLLVEEGKKEGLILMGRVLDVLDEQAKEARRLRWR